MALGDVPVGGPKPIGLGQASSRLRVIFWWNPQFLVYRTFDLNIQTLFYIHSYLITFIYSAYMILLRE